jgi:hypothetical protein
MEDQKRLEIEAQARRIENESKKKRRSASLQQRQLERAEKLCFLPCRQGHALGSTQGRMRIRLRLDKMDPLGCGIGLVPPDFNPFAEPGSLPGSYGVRSNGCTWVNGKVTCSDPQQSFRVGDVLELAYSSALRSWFHSAGLKNKPFNAAWSVCEQLGVKDIHQLYRLHEASDLEAVGFKPLAVSFIASAFGPVSGSPPASGAGTLSIKVNGEQRMQSAVFEGPLCLRFGAGASPATTWTILDSDSDMSTDA